MSYRSSKKLVTLIFTLVIIVLGSLGYLNSNTKSKPQITPTPTLQTIATASAELVKVVRVIDGDTIKLENGQTVRYIGIDTPELHHPQKSVQCFGQQTMEQNKMLVEGKSVRLIKDVSDTDRYGRLLRYVYVEDKTATPSSVFVNEYLVKEGYAYAAAFPPDIHYSELFKTEQNEAASLKKGLWDSCPLR